MGNQEPTSFNRRMGNTVIPQGLPGVFPKDDWNNNFNGVFPKDDRNNSFNGESAPIGMNPIINNNIDINPFDTDMSDMTNHSNSTGLTPASSNTNQSGPNSTYSPPQVEDDDSETQRNQPQTHSSFMSYDPRNPPKFAGAPNDPRFVPHDPFKPAIGWDSNAGTTPGFSGMTPGGEWEKLMQDGAWEQMMQDGTLFDQLQGSMSPR